MIHIKNKVECCGCTACYNACPKSAIEMKPDKEGFLYPSIDNEKCIDCGVCERVCPINNKEIHHEQTLGYIVRNKDEQIVNDSTSGGSFTAFAQYILKNGGVVYGAGYDVDMNVVCKCATDETQIAEMRGSKFVQSSLSDTYSRIKRQLTEGTLVLFTGTPCQVSGLVSFLRTKPNNLICMDFVCRGVPSPGLWRNYLDMMQKKYNSKVVFAKFKNKTYGYHATTMKIEFENGKVWYGSGRVDPMMKSFVNEMASRPSCGACSFKGIERVSDITMFDCYEYSTITEKKDDDKGYTSIFVHSDAGRDIFEKVYDNFDVLAVEVNRLVTKNGIMVCNSAKPSKKRDEFYATVAEMDIETAMKHVSPITKKDYFIEKCKGFLHRTGLIKLAKKMKKETITIAK